MIKSNALIRIAFLFCLITTVFTVYNFSQDSKKENNQNSNDCKVVNFLISNFDRETDTLPQLLRIVSDTAGQGSLLVAREILDCTAAMIPSSENERSKRLRGLYRIAQGRLKYFNQEYSKAITQINEGIQMIEKVSNYDEKDIAQARLALGASYFHSTEYDLALSAFFKSLKFFLSQHKKNAEKICTLYDNIGVIYLQSGRYKEAKIYLDHAKSFLNKNPHLSYLLYSHYALYYEYTGNTQMGIEMRKESIKELYKKYGKINHNFAKSYTNLGSVYFETQQFDSAVYYINKSIEVIRSNPERTLRNLDLGYGYFHQFNNYTKLEKPDSAYAAIDSILYHVSYSGVYNFDSIRDVRLFQGILLVASRYDKERYLVTKDVSSLYHARTLDSISVEYQYHLLKQRTSMANYIFSNNRHEVSSTAISTNILLYKATGNIKFAYDAYEICYKSKASLVQQSSAFASFSFPDSIIVKLHQMNEDIRTTRITVNALKEKGHDLTDSVYIKANATFHSAIEQKTTYLDKIISEQNAGDEIFKVKLPAISTVKSFLRSNNKKIVEYWIDSDKKMGLIFMMTPDTLYVEDVPEPSNIDNLIMKGRDQIARKDKDYNITSYQLYVNLLKPIEKHISENSNLIIIPDGKIGLFPFNALVIDSIQDNTKKYSYLLEKHTISYSNSISLLVNESRPQKRWGAKIFLGFAPVYEREESEPSGHRNDSLFSQNIFPNLRYNTKEVSSILSLTHGKIYTGFEATKNNFLDNISDYKILHLATHAKGDTSFGLFSYLVFSPETNPNAINSTNNVYYEDLANNKLKTEMVVLSACETAIGDNKEGEGIYSLSRALISAGVRSVISTLWAVDDRATMDIMVDFYKNLSRNTTKDRALQQAQLDYLRSHPGKHPYYWAAFIPTGDMSPVKLDAKLSLYCWVGIGTVLLAIIFISFKAGKK